MAQSDDPAFVQVRIRMRKSLQAQIEKARKEKGTSMNQEIVDRLEKSFEIDQIIGGSIVEDRAVNAIARMVASVMHDAGRHAAFVATLSPESIARWYNSPFAYDQAAHAARTIIEAFRPSGSTKVPGYLEGALPQPLEGALAYAGKGFANALLEQVARGAARTNSALDKVASLRDDLGELRERIKTLAVGSETSTREVLGASRRSRGRKS